MLPLDWHTGVVVPLFKDLDLSVCSNCHTPQPPLCQGVSVSQASDSGGSSLCPGRDHWSSSLSSRLQGLWEFAQPVYMWFVRLPTFVGSSSVQRAFAAAVVVFWRLMDNFSCRLSFRLVGVAELCASSVWVCQHNGAHIKMTLQSQRKTLKYKINTLNHRHQMMSVRPHQVSQSCVSKRV